MEDSIWSSREEVLLAAYTAQRIRPIQKRFDTILITIAFLELSEIKLRESKKNLSDQQSKLQEMTNKSN